jgi:uroporphyrinogen decarboxylase
MLENRKPKTLPVKPILSALNGYAAKTPPCWFMRQAGRYLPEYRETRAKAGGFLDLAFNPALAAEVTLQPIRRYGMDAAILFSDILVVPMMLGQDLKFAEGEGPVLKPVRSAAEIPMLTEAQFDKVTKPILETIGRIRHGLTAEGFHDTALIGFAGAPWTVACYMVEGSSSRDFTQVKRWAYEDPPGFGRLISEIAEATVLYLEAQVCAGAEVLQIFDSWAGALDEAQFRRWVIEPTRYIVQRLRLSCPDVPVIGFPRAAGQLYQDYVEQTGVDAVSLDPQVPLDWTTKTLQKKVAVQGNLDPVLLLTGGDAMKRETKRIIEGLIGGPFIFNLGHGIIKETPPEHVAQLMELIRNGKAS